MRRLSESFVLRALLVCSPPVVFFYLLHRAGELGHLWPYTIAFTYVVSVMNRLSENSQRDELKLHDGPNPLGARVAAPRPAPPSTSGGTGCGGDGSSGLLLFRAYDERGKPARPSLRLVGSEGTVLGGVDVPDPHGATAIASGCRAVVQAGKSATYIVNGANGTAIKLDLRHQDHSLIYINSDEGGRYGFFSDLYLTIPIPRQGATLELSGRSALVDFATGAVTDLHDIYRAQFSPDGETLAVATIPDWRGYGGLWLMPTKDPRQIQEVSGRCKRLCAYDGQRLLYVERGKTEYLLVSAGTADGTRTVIARTPDRHEDPELEGWFLPGSTEIVVRFPDRFAVVDPSGEIPRERFSLDGKFPEIYLSSSGKGVVLQPYAHDADSTPKFVDLVLGTVRRLESDGGVPAYLEEVEMWWVSHARWLLVSFSGDEDAPSALAILDAESGAMSPLPVMKEVPEDVINAEISADGQRILLLLSGWGRGRYAFVDLERGAVTEFDNPGSVSMKLSPDGRWAAHSMLETTTGKGRWVLSIVEMATGKRTLVGPGMGLEWLVP